MLPPLTPSRWLAAHHWQRRTDVADPGQTEWEPRVDRGQLLSAVRRPDGTLLVEGYAARAGILEYRNADGSIRRELVRAETLRQSASSLGRTTVTLGHRGDITPDNVGEHGVGDVDGEVTIEEGGFVRVKLAVRRRDAITAVDAGTQELSPGYLVRIDNTPGVDPEFGPYDAEQVERLNNHLAIVDRARGGSAVRLRADCAIPLTLIERRADRGDDPPPPGARMNPRLALLLSLLGDTQQRYDSDEAAISAAIHLVRSRADGEAEAVTTAHAARDAAIERATTAEASAQVATDKLTALEAEAQARTDAAERTSLVEVATAHQVDATQHTETADLKKAIAKAYMGAQLREDATDAYIDVVVDMARNQPRADGTGRAAGASAWGAPPPNQPPQQLPPQNPPQRRADAQPRGMGGRWMANLNRARTGGDS